MVNVKVFIKKYMLLIIALLLLVVFGIIGQAIKKVKERAYHEEEIQAFNSYGHTQTEKEKVIQHIRIIDAIDTKDNPWGKTAGVIDLDDKGKVIFLTPGTSAVIYELYDFTEIIQLTAEIFNDVKEHSDGVTLSISIYDRNDIELENERRIYIPSSEATTISVDTSINDIDHAIIRCLNEDNENGDWIILSF